jgi:hypothetical protein
MELDDGTIVPSFMEVRERGHEPTTQHFNNHCLRQGEIKKINYPKDKQRYITYDVSVQHADGNSPGATSRYVGCMVANLFGGKADSLKYTLRADDKKNTGQDTLGNGSKVLLLCINGNQNGALIIGGVRDGKIDTANDKESDGHHLDFVFNGVSANINKDGEFKLQFLGRTKFDGKIDIENGAKEEASPTTLEITKDGSIEIYTKDRKQFFKFDHENKKATFQADESWNIQINGDWISNVEKKVDWTFGDTCTIAIAKDTSINVSGGKLNLGASGDCIIKSTGVKIGSAGEAFPMFSKYRQAESSLHQTLLTQFTQISLALIAMGPALAIPMGAGGAAAAAQCVLASTAIIQCVTALTQFEAKATTYLSTKNKND